MNQLTSDSGRDNYLALVETEYGCLECITVYRQQKILI
jgi:hypothetical protein